MVPWRPEMSTAATESIPTSTPHSSPPDAAAAALSLNGPESEPVLFQPQQKQPQRKQDPYNNDETNRCRSCDSTSIVTDWNQGDRICTNCGVVVEEHIPVDIEWRDFNDADDIAKGKQSGARSGLVPVDETKYVGGLQPTRLSKHAFGGDNSLISMGKRLKATNKRLDVLMEKQFRKSVQDAKLDRKIRLKQQSNVDIDNAAEDGETFTLRPEMEQLILQEEEDAHRMQAALYSEKWSLDRALLIYGDCSPQQEEEREDMLGRMDKTLRKASEDMYTAHTILIKGAQTLHLPDRVRNEVIHRLVRFVTRRDGFFIKGVSSRLSKHYDPAQRKKAAEQLREHNKLKQMGALASAILFLTARSLGWTRTIAEVCSSIEPPATCTVSIQQQQQKQPFVKAKHCSKAIHEIRVTFPDMVAESTQSQASQSKCTKAPPPPPSSLESNDSVATSNFAEHSLRRLQLPPVAEVCARALLLHCRDRQVQIGRNSGTKLSVLCAAVTYFVCSAGTIMQRLAQQTAQRQQLDCIKQNVARRVSTKKRIYGQSTNSTRRKKLKSSDQSSNVKQEESKRVDFAVKRAKLDYKDSDDDDDETLDDKKRPRKGNDDDEPFDVFSHAPIVEDQTEKHKYEMRRMWDAWSEQMSWHRSVSEIEQSCGVSRTVLLDFYKTHLYPQRNELLQVLGDAVKDTSSNRNDAAGEATGIVPMLRGAPLARILLIHVTTAAQLMNSK